MSKVILITGGSSGIGKAIATYLSKNNGYIVYGSSRNLKKLENTSFLPIKLDVTSKESISKCIQKIIKDQGRIDVLINNAGVGITGPLEETPNAEIEKHFKTNLYGPINLIKTVLPYMRKNNSGLIINITSIAGHIGTPFRSIYSAGKSSLDIISETLNMETKDFNINVKVDYRNGNILKEYKLKSNFFAEGITVLNNKIYQLTWKEKIGFIYDVNTFDQINSFEYNNSLEGWGICNDGSKLYKSDGTEKIWLLDPINQKEDGFIEIYTNKNKVVGLNELEWVNGKIFANRYLFDGIAIINPNNGGIEAVINLSSLKNMVTKHEKLDVINGIAYNEKRNSIFVTGKMWDKIFEIRIKK